MNAHAPTGSSSSTQLPTASTVLQELPFKWNVQGRIFIIGGLGFMFDAWDVSLNSILIPLLRTEWGLETGEAAWIGTANLIGMAVGAFLWGTIADRLGRKAAFSWTLGIFAVFTVAGALTDSLGWFVFFRFLAGIGLGGAVPVDYALVGEFTPRKQRGIILTAMDGWWPIGAALAGVVSAWLMAMFGDWRYPLLVMVLPALLIMFVRLFIPESPMYLLKQGRDQEARKVIDDMVARTGAEARPYRTDMAAAQQEPFTPLAFVHQLVALWRFSPKITAVSWLLFLTIMTMYYIGLQWMPTFLIEAGYEQQRAFLTSAGMAGVGFLGVVIAAVLVERTGRKAVLAIFAPASGVLLVVLAMLLSAKNPAVLWLVLAYGTVVQIAIPVLYAYVSEMYPTALRGSGFGWASTISRVGAGFGPLLFVTALVPMLGLVGAFWTVTAVVSAAALVMLFFAPETKGQQLD
ncbi:MFS transporter [Micrococcoides hystricis]|uniref:MFS transporter n=1 Tax=Micrococcoides hystricis TaxID=1572761 RepID=A0ABV6P9T0_9MICC